MQQAVFHKLAKANFVMESQSTGTQMAVKVLKRNTVCSQMFKFNLILAVSNFTRDHLKEYYILMGKCFLLKYLKAQCILTHDLSQEKTWPCH